MSRPGDFCRANKDVGDPANIIGCSGEGRPSCKAGECLYGAEPCPKCNGFKPEGEGDQAACLWCKAAARTDQGWAV